MFLTIVIFGFVLKTASGQGSQPAACDKSTIANCIAPFSNGPFDNGGPLAGPVNMSLLQKTCNQLLGVTNCLMTDASTCQKYDLLQTTDLLESIRYICNEGNAGFIKFQSCMTDDSKMQQYFAYFYSCYTDMSTFVPDVNIYGQICKQNNGVYSCYVNASKVCDSADFVVNYYKKMNTKLSLYYYCDINYQNWNTTQPYSQCNVTMLLQNCLPRLAMASSQAYPLNPYLFTLSDSILSSVCSAFTEAVICATSQCGAELALIPQVSHLFNTTNYICNVDRNGYNNIARCAIANPSVFSSCFNTPSTNCGSINTQHACLVDAATRYCNDKSFVQNVYYLAMQSMLDSDCQLSLKLTNFAPANGCIQMQCGVLCGYGFKKYANGCDKCECVNPCENVICPQNYICRVEDRDCPTPCVPVTNCYQRRLRILFG